VNDIQLWPGWTSDLDRQHVTRERPGIDTTYDPQAHHLCRLFNHIWELTEVGHGLTERLELGLLRLRAKLVWSDCDCAGRRCRATEDDLDSVGLTPAVFEILLTSVANLVHRFSLRGNRISVMASSTELLPDDWSPQTTSWGSSTMPLSPVRRSLSTMSITLR
jgi:hypothetical protein